MNNKILNIIITCFFFLCIGIENVKAQTVTHQDWEKVEIPNCNICPKYEYKIEKSSMVNQYGYYEFYIKFRSLDYKKTLYVNDVLIYSEGINVAPPFFVIFDRPIIVLTIYEYNPNPYIFVRCGMIKYF